VKPKRLLQLLCLLLVLSMVAAACGDDDDSTSSSGNTTETTASGGAAKELKPVPGFDGTTIKLGVLTPLTGTVAVIGKPLTAGNKAWFDSVNAKGGIAGKYKVELDVQDTKYDPPTTVQAYNQIKSNVVMFAQILGTQPIKAVLPQLKSDKIVAQPTTLDSDWLGEQNLLPIGAPYQIQSMNAVYYWVNDGGGKGKTLCALSQDDAYGQAGLEGVQFAADKLGTKLAASPKFKVTDQDFTAQINQLKSANCDAVYFVGTAANLSGVMTAAVQNNLETQWIGQSPSWLGLFANTGLKDYLVKHFWLISDGPTWDQTDDPGVKAMIALHDQYAKDVQPGDQYFSFGVAAAQAVTQVLEKAVEMGDLSHDGIIKAMNSIDELTFGDFFAPYAWGPPGKRNPPRTSTMYKVDPTKPNGITTIKAGIEAPFAKDFKLE
jgi:ABC-type branched-subunit amino acid transport system substrate-binding protein